MKKLFATKLAVLALVPLFTAQNAGAAASDYEVRETIVHVTHNTLQVDLNEKTVICSRADYSMPMLKVLIPGLSGITLLNHQNFGAGAPCVTTGQSCQSFGRGSSTAPADILQGQNGVEPVEVVVTETRLETINHIEKTCTVRLREHVETVIRGKRLFHDRENELAARRYEDCVNGGGRIVAVP
jgi:hypothetical protein